jgi:Skp family chaperone for outer membrane proteins
MIVKCTKTGKILSTDEEMRDHAEAFGVAGFEEIDPQKTHIWYNPQSGKHCFTANEVDVFCRRSGDDKTSFVEIPVSEFLSIRASKKQDRRNDQRVESFANEKLLTALVDIKGYTTLQAEKALWFTRNESLIKAEEWLRNHSKDADFNSPLILGENGKVPDSLTTPSEVQNIPLSDYVKRDIVTELMSMGFSETRAIRAVWKTENGGVEVAVEWLSSHADEDLLPEFIPIPAKQPKLSKEEAQRAALELQRKLREERIAREATEARDKEKQRIAHTKALQEQQAQLQESQRIREIAEREREKRLQEEHRAQVAEKLRQDFIERFGYEPPEDKKSKLSDKPKDKILFYLNQIKRNHPSNIAREALSTFRMYLGNIEKNSSDKKFHKIKITNKIFVEKISPVREAVEILHACGFEDSDECLEIKTSIADGWLAGQAVKYIDVILNSI